MTRSKYTLILFLAFSSNIHSSDSCDNTSIDDCKARNIVVVMDSGSMYVNWLSPDSTKCPTAKEYRLLYSVNKNGETENFGPIETIQNSNVARVDLGELFCERIKVEISTLDENNCGLAISDEILLERNIPMPEITKVEESENPGKLKVYWDPLWDSAKTDCTVSYSIKYKDEDPINIEGTDCEITATELNVCTKHTLEITASSNDYISESSAYDYDKNLPEIKIVDVINDQSSFIFEPLEEISNNCGQISYKINQKNLKCFKKSYTVTAIADANYQSDESKPIEIQNGPEPVKNVTFEMIESEIRLNWDPPSQSNGCSIQYEITVDEEESIYNTHLTSIRFQFETNLISCVAKPIDITGIVESVKGESKTILVYGVIEAAQNLECSLEGSDNVHCTWIQPENSENCNEIWYRVDYFNGDDLESQDTTDLSISLEGIGCNLGWLSIQTYQIVDEKVINGKFTETVIKGCKATRNNPFKRLNFTHLQFS